MRFDVDADIRRARTPPHSLYTDPAWFDRQRERVFARTWQLVSATDGLEEPGSARPFTLLPDCLDEPLLLVRDSHDQLHCLSNVCTHRGNLIVESECSLSALKCRYHGRRYHLDGTFAFMPGFEGVADFPSEADYLPRIAVAAWRRLLFASLTPAVDANEMIEPVEQRLEGLGAAEWKFDPESQREYEVDANWVAYVENYCEGFHIPVVHPELARKLDMGGYRVETWEHGSLQVGAVAPGEPCFEFPASHPDHGKQVGGYYFFLFPNTLLNVYPWGLSLNVVQPIGHLRTRIRYYSFVADESERSRGLGGDLDTVEQQDQQVVRNVQVGMRARLAREGRYSPTEEIGVHHFHRMLAKWLDV